LFKNYSSHDAKESIVWNRANPLARQVDDAAWGTLSSIIGASLDPLPIKEKLLEAKPLAVAWLLRVASEGAKDLWERLNERELEQEKLRRDLSLAVDVQKRLLPTELPSADIADFSAVSLPARSIGGDYYDFIHVGDRRIGLALADVSGKGIAAALIMSVVQASLRIIASDADVSLPGLAAKMNEFLYRATPGNKYATFFYAQVDAGRRQLRYVNAGHNPPLLVRAGGQAEGGDPKVHELSVGGAVIGMLPVLTYEEAVVDLVAGYVLLAFTDGVSEAHNPDDEEFGDDRLKQLLQGVAHLPAAGIAAQLSAALTDWIRDAEQFDDLTFVVMKVR
jgi:sigma-B regulation protein RsbU (phosphoserine phosphatase)